VRVGAERPDRLGFPPRRRSDGPGRRECAVHPQHHPAGHLASHLHPQRGRSRHAPVLILAETGQPSLRPGNDPWHRRVTARALSALGQEGLSMNRHALAGLLAAVLLPALTGCGSNSDLCPISGTLTYKGRPMPQVYLRFEPDDLTTKSTSMAV